MLCCQGVYAKPVPQTGRAPKDPLHERHRGNRLRFAKELSETAVTAEKLANDYEKLVDRIFSDFVIVENGEDLGEDHLPIVNKFKELAKRLDDLGHLIRSFAPVIDGFKTKVPRDAAHLEKAGDELVALAVYFNQGTPVPQALLGCKEKHILTWRQPHIALEHHLKRLGQPLGSLKGMLTQRAEFLRWQNDGSLSRHMHGVWTGERN